MGNIKRVEYEDFRGDRNLHGFREVMEWRCTEDGAPWSQGEYICSNGDGKTFLLNCTGCNCDSSKLARSILNNREYCQFDDGSEITDSDIVRFLQSYSIWYHEETIEEYGDWMGTSYVVFKNPPKYYLVSEITGPIDGEDYGEADVEKDLAAYLVDHDPERRDKMHIPAENSMPPIEYRSF